MYEVHLHLEKLKSAIDSGSIKNNLKKYLRKRFIP